MAGLAFLFPGQGAQTVGMGKQLADNLPAARKLFDDADQILGYDLSRICFQGPSEELDSTVHSQPALFVCSLAALEQVPVRRAALGVFRTRFVALGATQADEMRNLAGRAAGLIARAGLDIPTIHAALVQRVPEGADARSACG